MLKRGGEVLVTNGAIASPQLLMCSGIGPRKHLEEHGISVVSDLPGVGENLQDHPSAVVSFKTPKKGVSVTSKLRLFGHTNPFPVLNWFVFKRGLLTSTGCDHGAFASTAASDGQPDLQVRFIAAKALGPDGMTTFTQFRNSKNHVRTLHPLHLRRLSHVCTHASVLCPMLLSRYFRQEDGYSFQSVAVRAKSAGSVRLASSNTHVKPVINAGYFSNPTDLATLREGIKLGRKLGRRSEWKEYLGEEVYPGPNVRTDDQIDEYIKNTVHTANALTGTCKMGTGPDAVVGPDLRVIGVNGVRVADSSIIPVIPGGQTGTPTVMVADRAASFILGQVEPHVVMNEMIHEAGVTPAVATA